MISLYRTLSLRYLQQRWSRAFLVTASIGLGVATLVATQTLNRTMLAGAKSAVSPLAGLADLHINNNDAGVPADLVRELSGVHGVRSIDPVMIERVALPDLDNQTALALGVDLKSLAGRENPWGVQVQLTNPFALFAARKPIFLGKELAQKLANVLPPSQKSFQVRFAGRIRRLPRGDGTIDAQGPAAMVGGNMLVMDLAECASLRDHADPFFGAGMIGLQASPQAQGAFAAVIALGRPRLVTRLDVSLEPNVVIEDVRRELEKIVANRALVQTPESQAKSVQDVMAGLQIGFAVCGTGALIVGLFLVYNALAVSVAERRHDIGVLRSLGATRGQVWLLFVGEAALLGIAGSLVGIPAGEGLARIGAAPMREVLSDLFISFSANEVESSAGIWIGSAIAGIVTAIIAALVPARSAAHAQPAEAMRRMPLVASFGQLVAWAAACLILIGAGVGTVAAKDVILSGRVATYCGLLVFAGLLLMTPVFAVLMSRLLRPVVARLFGIEERLAADNLIRSPRRTGVVIMALAAGVAMVLQTAGIIRSNRDAILDWVDETFAADLFVTSGSPVSGSGKNQPLPESVGNLIRSLDGVQAVVPIRFRSVEYGDTRVFLEAMDARGFYEHDSARGYKFGLDNLPRLAEDGERPNVLVSENFAALHGKYPGDLIELRGPHGPIPVQIVGTVLDYSWNRGTVMMDRKHYRKHFEDNLVDVFDVYVRPVASSTELQQTIGRRWGPEHALVILTKAELRERISGMIERLYGIAYSQEGVVGMVAALGVLTALLISVLQRRRELGLLRAVGATRGQVVRTVIAEAALMGLIGTAIGLLVGAALEWYCIRVILFEEAGFLFPVLIPWRDTLWIALVGILTAAAAGLGPALHTTRLRIPEAIAYE